LEELEVIAVEELLDTSFLLNLNVIFIFGAGVGVVDCEETDAEEE